jgi:hypothetical protein
MTSLSTLLSKYPAHVWRGRQDSMAAARLPTGYQALDKILGGGWPPGSLVEVLTSGPGLGELTLLIPAVAACTRAGQMVAWLPSELLPYAPALVQAGVDLRRLLLVAVRDDRQKLWAAEQCLRSGACTAVIIAASARTPDKSLRRLKLAAAAGGGTGFLLGDASAAGQASPASVRLAVERPIAAPQSIQVVLLKCRGQPPGSLRLQDSH